MKLSEYYQHDALGLAQLVKQNQVTPKELLKCAIEATQKSNPHINAIIHSFEAAAFDAIEQGLPNGPFHGVPFLLKDLISTIEGQPFTMGSRGISTVPEYDSEIVKRYKSAGLVPFGLTNTPEFGLTISTEPKLHGPTHNPHKLGFSSGGSSGGSAAAVAAGIVPIAGGSDGGGSIRFPSSWCGVFGMKPSRGRTPVGPDFGELWNGASTSHAISRSVRDNAAMLDCTAGPELGGPFDVQNPKQSFLDAAQSAPRKLRIALSQQPLIDTEVDDEVLQSLHATAEELRALGHIVEEVEPDIDRDRFWRDFFYVVSSNMALLTTHVKEEMGVSATRQFEPSTKSLAAIGRSIKAHELLEALHGWHLAQVAMGDIFRDYDVMLCPTVPTVAVEHGVLTPSSAEEMLMQVGTILGRFGVTRAILASGVVEKLAKPVLEKMAFTVLGNITGLPCMSVPLYKSAKGLPIGMQFYGRMCDEGTLYNLAMQLESNLGFTCHQVVDVKT